MPDFDWVNSDRAVVIDPASRAVMLLATPPDAPDPVLPARAITIAAPIMGPAALLGVVHKLESCMPTTRRGWRRFPRQARKIVWAGAEAAA